VSSTKNLIYKEDNGSEINATTISLLSLNSNYFTTDNNGTAELHIKINTERNASNSINPFVMSIADINVSDANNTQGTINLDKNATFLYGRTNAPRQRFTTNPATAFIYYEVYCNGSDTNAVDCNKTLLPNGSSSVTINDPRWFKNTSHFNSTDGTQGTVTQKNATLITETGSVTANPAQTTLSYDVTKGYPYKATMENNASTWLIYNKYNANATTNEFEVEFVHSGGWAGQHETNTTTKNNAVTTTNRRSMW
jgi:hypothetical protein